MEFSGDRLEPLPGLGRVVILDDFNEDGRLDLLTTGDRPGSETDSLVLLPGLEAGRFGQAQLFPVFPNVIDLIAADFNHDGRVDVAVLTTRVRLFVFENHTPVGSATFELPLAQSPRLPRANFQVLRLGDSDGDGWEDLFLWHPTAPELLVYRNGGNAPGGFPFFSQQYSFVPETLNYASSFAVEDFTGDGLSDVALLRGDPFEQVRQVEIYRALESPEGEEPPLELHFTVPLSGFPGQMVAGWIDADEVLDLLVVSDFQRRLELFRGESEDGLPTGRFASLGEIEIGPRQRQGQFILTDLNSDGLTDIVDPEVQVFYQEPSAVEGQVSFKRVALPAVEGSRFGVADLNGDGLPDLVSTMGEQPFAGVFLAREGLGGEPPQFGASNFLDVGQLEHLVAAGDLDGDGRSDLAVAIEPLETTGDRIIVLESLGGGQFQLTGEMALSGRVEQLAWFDLTGDGAAELVALQSAPDEVRVYEVDFGQPPALRFSAEVASRPRRFHLTDFDGDGAADLALVHDGSFSTGEEARLSLWQGQADGAFVLAGERDVNGAPGLKRLRRLLSGDFNGDRLRDLVVLNTAQGDETDWLIFYGDGTLELPAYEEEGFSLGEGRDPLDFDAGDINGDGLVDLGFVFADGFGCVLGGGGFTELEFQSSEDLLQFAGLNLADLRNLGQPDWIQGGGRILTLRPHQGDDLFFPYAGSLSYAGGAVEFALGDFDGDGGQDIATVDSLYLRIFLNETQGLPPPLPTPTPSQVPTSRPTSTPTATLTPTPSPTPTGTAVLDADFDNSGVVDAEDLLQLLRDWRYWRPEPVSDLDGDGTSGPGDLFLFQGQWQESR